MHAEAQILVRGCVTYACQSRNHCDIFPLCRRKPFRFQLASIVGQSPKSIALDVEDRQGGFPAAEHLGVRTHSLALLSHSLS